MLARQLVVIDAIDDRQIGLVARCRDEDLLGPGFQMGGRLVARGEEAGAFHGDVDADLAPGQGFRIALGGHLDRAATDIDRVALDRDRTGEAAMDTVIADEMGIGLDRTEIVDRDDFDIGAARFDDRPKHIATDAAKTVDCDANCHEGPPLRYAAMAADRGWGRPFRPWVARL